MADAKITALTAVTTPTSDDLFVIVDDPSGTPVTKKITLANLSAYLAALTETLTNKTLTSPTLNGAMNGWIEVSDSWAYSATVAGVTVTIPTGGGGKYRKGDFFRYKQGGGYKYGQCYTIADTLIHLGGGSGYSVANSAITDIAYSHQRPVDFPGAFDVGFSNFTTSGTAFTNQPTGDLLEYSQEGAEVSVHGLFHTHATSGGTLIFYINTVAGQLPTISRNGSVGVALNLSARSKNGQVYVGSAAQNKIEIQNYDATAIAGNGAYVEFNINYRIN